MKEEAGTGSILYRKLACVAGIERGPPSRRSRFALFPRAPRPNSPPPPFYSCHACRLTESEKFRPPVPSTRMRRQLGGEVHSHVVIL